MREIKADYVKCLKTEITTVQIGKTVKRSKLRIMKQEVTSASDLFHLKYIFKCFNSQRLMRQGNS